MSRQKFLKGCGPDHCILQPQNERIWICLNGMLGREFGREDKSCWISRWWQLKDVFIFTPKIGEMIQFDSYFSRGVGTWNDQPVIFQASIWGGKLQDAPLMAGWEWTRWRFAKVIRLSGKWWGLLVAMKGWYVKFAYTSLRTYIYIYLL